MTIAQAIYLTLLASVTLNLAIVLLKKSIRELGGSAGRRPFRMLIHSRTGRISLAMLPAGYALFVLAASARTAPISVLRPLCSFGMVVVVVLAVIVLKERLKPVEWLGLTSLLAGTILVGVSAGSENVPVVHWSRLGFFLLGCLLIGVTILWLSAYLGIRRAEVATGAIVGLLFGCAYLAVKTTFLARQEGRTAVALVALATMCLATLGGIAVLMSSFRWGRALIIRGTNFVVNQVIVILGGAFCLGESFPEQPLSLLLKLLGFAAIIIGALLLLLAGRNGSMQSWKNGYPRARGTQSQKPPASVLQCSNTGLS